MFKKAEKKQVKLRIALTGPSGAGKTYSALAVAKGISDKVAFIDTEEGSASLYADRFNFDVMELRAPYSTDKYIQAIQSAQEAGYEVIIVDSLSHQWAGEGGILNKKEQMDSRGGNSYTNWGKLTPEHERMKSAILNCKSHIICTMRSKQDYVMTENEKGKIAPKKMGLAPVQRDGMEYEFTVVLDLDMSHIAKASKDRTSLFDDLYFKPSEQTGKDLMKWLMSGAPILEEKKQESTWKPGKAELDKVVEMASQAKIDLKEVSQYIQTQFNKKSSEMNEKEYLQLISHLAKASHPKEMAPWEQDLMNERMVK